MLSSGRLTAISARPSALCSTGWSRQADELAGQGFTQTDHGVTQGHFLRQLLQVETPLSDTLITKIALLPAVDAATKAGTATLYEHCALVNRGRPRAEDASKSTVKPRARPASVLSPSELLQSFK